LWIDRFRRTKEAEGRICLICTGEINLILCKYEVENPMNINNKFVVFRCYNPLLLLLLAASSSLDIVDNNNNNNKIDFAFAFLGAGVGVGVDALLVLLTTPSRHQRYHQRQYQRTTTATSHITPEQYHRRIGNDIMNINTESNTKLITTKLRSSPVTGGGGMNSRSKEEESPSTTTVIVDNNEDHNDNKGGGFFSRIVQRKRQLFPLRHRQKYRNHDGIPGYYPFSMISTEIETLANAVQQQQQKHHQQQRRTTNKRRLRPPPMLQISDIQQYKEEVVNSKDSALVVVRFYASWCKACKAIEGKYHRLPQEFPSNNVIKFVEIPLTKQNAYLHKGLDIPSLPYAHIYYNNDYDYDYDHNNYKEDKSNIDDTNYDDNDENFSPPPPTTTTNILVEELKINKNEFSNFRRIIRSYVNRECEVYYTSSSNNSNNNHDDNNDKDNNFYNDTNNDDEEEEIIKALSTSPHHHKLNNNNSNTIENAENELIYF